MQKFTIDKREKNTDNTLGFLVSGQRIHRVSVEYVVTFFTKESEIFFYIQIRITERDPGILEILCQKM